MFYVNKAVIIALDFKNFEETKAFIDKLKQAYFCLLKYGSLSLIGNNYEEFEGDFC